MTKEELRRFVEAMPDGAVLEYNFGGSFWGIWDDTAQLKIRVVLYPSKGEGRKEKEVRGGHAENDQQS